MYGVMRSYSGEGAKKLAALLEERKAEVEKVIRDVPGLITWGLMKTPDGCTTFTLCKDKAGADQSVAVARDWIKQNASGINAAAPTDRRPGPQPRTPARLSSSKSVSHPASNLRAQAFRFPCAA